MDPNKIGKFILKLRTEQNLSQYQLADKIPISRQAVSKWERGVTIPDASTLVRLSEILNVSINELLKGERLKENSLKQLESTTLEIVDESNKMKRILKLSMTVIIFLLLTFLTYYFINSFNTIKVYTLGGSGEHFEIHDGIFITTKTKTYLKLGDIEFHDNEEINNIRVYYKKGTEQKLIFENKDLDKIIIDTSGYNEMFIEKDIPDMIKNVYAEIIYNENQTETIKIQFVRDFTNAEYLFHKNRKVTRLDPKPLKDNELEQKAISIIKEKGILEGENYILDIKEKNIRFSYHPEAGQIIMNENEEAKWTIFVDTGTYYCFESELENPKECQKQVKESIEKYLLEE